MNRLPRVRLLVNVAVQAVLTSSRDALSHTAVQILLCADRHSLQDYDAVHASTRSAGGLITQLAGGRKTLCRLWAWRILLLSFILRLAAVQRRHADKPQT